MFVYELLTALLFTIIVGGIFVGLRRTGPWEGLLWFFLILFLFTWAGGVWIEPFGPSIAGVYWVPFLSFAILIALLLAAVSPPKTPHSAIEAKIDAEDRIQTATALTVAVGALFYLIVGGLVVAVMFNYI